MPIENERITFIVTIKKKPSQSCGLYIREDVITCEEGLSTGIFLSRIIKEESLSEENERYDNSVSPLNQLEPGDQILSVNGVELNHCHSIDSVVSMMSTASTLTMKIARQGKIIKDENISCTSTGTENVEPNSDWRKIEKEISPFHYKSKQTYLEKERSSNSNDNNSCCNNSLNPLDDQSLQKTSSSILKSMKRYPFESSFDEATSINRNLDIRRLQLEQPSADDSNDSGLSSENSHTSRDLYYPRYSDLACHPYIQGVYQKYNTLQRKPNHDQTSRNYMYPNAYDSMKSSEIKMQQKSFANSPNVCYGYGNPNLTQFPRDQFIPKEYPVPSQSSQYLFRKQPCSNIPNKTFPKEDKSTQCNQFDYFTNNSNSQYKRYPLDYNSDSEVAAYEINDKYKLNVTEKSNSMNRTSSMRNHHIPYRDLGKARNFNNESRNNDVKGTLVNNSTQRSLSNYKRTNSREQMCRMKSFESENEVMPENTIKSIQPRVNSATEPNVMYSTSSMTDVKLSPINVATTLNSSSLLSNVYVPSEGNDFRILPSERWMKPISSLEQFPGVAGILIVNVIAGCALQSNHSLLRDLYCVLEIDSVRKARSMIRTSTEVFEWDEIFEIDLWNSHFLSILLYQWDPKTHHRLCFYGGINLVTFIDSFQLNDVGVDKVILQLEPKGLLYLEMAFLTWELSLIRQINQREKSVFGRPGNALTSAVSFTSGFDTRPFVLTLCIEEIERRGLDTIGLYRLCGAAKLKAHLRQLFEINMEFTDLSTSAIPDVHVITSVLKDFLRELPEPLFTTSMYKLCLKSAFHSSTYDTQEGLLILINIFLSLPPVNRDSLIYLLDHLVRVAQKNDINKMTFLELSIIFASLILQPSYDQLPGCQDGVHLAKMEIEFIHNILTKWSNIKSRILSHKYLQVPRRPNVSNNNKDNPNSCSIAIQTTTDDAFPTSLKGGTVSTPKKSFTNNNHPPQSKSILRNSSSKIGISDRRSVHDVSCEDML